MMMSRAVTLPPTSTRPGRLYSMLLVPVSLPLPIRMSCNQRGLSASGSLQARTSCCEYFPGT